MKTFTLSPQNLNFPLTQCDDHLPSNTLKRTYALNSILDTSKNFIPFTVLASS